jgi:hypothetical protein
VMGWNSDVKNCELSQKVWFPMGFRSQISCLTDSLDASLVRARLAMSIMVPDFEFDESVDSPLPGGVGRIIEWLGPPMDR